MAFIVPVTLGLSLFYARRRGAGERGAATVALPWFVRGFLAVLGINSAGALPAATDALIGFDTFLLAMAAMGLVICLADLRRVGLTPL